MDSVRVVLADGRKARALTAPDVFTREAVAVRADARFTAGTVVRVLEGLAYPRGVPRSMRADSGPEFAGTMPGLGGYFNNVTPDFSRPGKPTGNALIESFNGRLRRESLDPHRFTCLDGLPAKTEDWRREYNEDRPHGALGNLAPQAFAAEQAGKTKPDQPPKRA
jgi:putative transposase